MNMNDLTEQIELACLMEATARKPGNVHPGASFDDLTYDDFATAARISAPILARASDLGVGWTVLEAVKTTVAETGTNVNLGMCLLIAPLAAAPANQPLASSVKSVLQALTVDDAKFVYEAIRLAKPGGLGEVPEQDVRHEPTQTLLEVMRLAVERDSIAAEYARSFQTTLMAAQFWTRNFFHQYHQRAVVADDSTWLPVWEFITIGMQLTFLRMQGDTLIRRKCGERVNHEAACRAEFLLNNGSFFGSGGVSALAEFDAWLRTDGHRRNPGTTADLIAAIWFAAIREGWVVPPTKEEIVEHAARVRKSGRM
jgi:triphosphoribosyl-dephospho-CoA synthase